MNPYQALAKQLYDVYAKARHLTLEFSELSEDKQQGWLAVACVMYPVTRIAAKATLVADLVEGDAEDENCEAAYNELLELIQEMRQKS